MLAAFVLVQGFALVALRELQQLPDLTRTITATGALQLGLVQLAGLCAGLVLVVAATGGWRTVGLGSMDAGGGWRRLAPVGLLVILPAVGYSVASGDPLIGDGITLPLATVFVLLAVLIAVNEELWFRGIVIERLGGVARPMSAVLVSAVLFGLPHVAGTPASWLNTVAVTLAVGVPFAVVRLQSGSLLAAIGWHAIIDIWAFLHTGSVIPQGEPDAAQAVASLLLPAALAAAYLLSLRRWTRAGSPQGRDRAAVDR